jgi:photosystem II stability/assembly factor-like uncharacterized protein
MDILNNANINFTLSNINLDFSNIDIKRKYSIELSGTWWNVAISETGQYQIAVQNSNNGRIYISDDYGIKWEPLKNDSLIGLFVGITISNNGKYQSALQQNGGILLSSDYGNTWRVINLSVSRNINNELIIVNTIKNWWAISMSATGQYQTAVSTYDDPDKGGYIYISNDYGLSWIDVTPKNIITPGYYYGVSLSYSGKIQLTVITTYSNSTGEVFLSSYTLSYDYGLTWTDPVPLGINLLGCVVNKSPDETIDGKYQYLVEQGGDGIFRSDDFGVTWNLIYPNSLLWQYITVSETGKYVYCSAQSNYITFSNDYGITWTIKYFNYGLNGISTSADGSIVTILTYTNKILISYDYGKTFTFDNNSPLYKNINRVKTSSNGQIQSVSITNGNVLVSYDYGNNWNAAYDVKEWSPNDISLTGQYQTVYELNGNCYTSYDYGKTWNKGDNLNLTNVVNINMSGDGKYQMIVNGAVLESTTPCIYLSYNYGLNWVPIVISTITNLYGSAMSLNGQYISLIDDLGEDYSGGYIYVSNDYGMTFTLIENTGPYDGYDVSMSGCGKYHLGTSLQYYFISSDYGKTWSKRIILEIDGLEYYDLYIPIKCYISSTGEFQYISLIKSDKIKVIYSKNYGFDWKILDTSSSNNSCYLASTSSNGQYLAFSNQNNICELYFNQLFEL